MSGEARAGTDGLDPQPRTDRTDRGQQARRRGSASRSRVDGTTGDIYLHDEDAGANQAARIVGRAMGAEKA
jgi:hypothetical protein